MRRVIVALAGAGVGLWWLLGFKSAPSTRLALTPPATTPPPTTTVATAPATGARTIDGDVIATRYGDVQVAIVLAGGRITDIKALRLPFDRARSQLISDQAAPLLHDEVLQAQNAQIDTIGGATYTSEAYAESLQSALDRAQA